MLNMSEQCYRIYASLAPNFYPALTGNLICFPALMNP